MVKAEDHFLRSSYREMLLEHLFSGEVMRHAWLSGIERLEVLKPQVDDGGYDLLLEANDIVRHVQLKGKFQGSKVSSFKVNTALASKPSGCVIVVMFDPQTLALGPFLWFGSPPGTKLPDLSRYAIAKHTKANAKGEKLPRQRIRAVPRKAFETIPSISMLAGRLFG